MLLLLLLSSSSSLLLLLLRDRTGGASHWQCQGWPIAWEGASATIFDCDGTYLANLTLEGLDSETVWLSAWRKRLWAIEGQRLLWRLAKGDLLGADFA